MNRRVIVTAVLLLVVGTISRAQHPNLAYIDAEVGEAMKQWQTPGTAVIIVRPDRVVLLKGYGVRELGGDRRIDVDTLFPIASCTKSFTSTAMAMLVDDRKVQWEDPVAKHWPAFRLADANANALVTVRDLLSHRTGLGSHDYLWFRAAWDQNEMIRRVGRLPLTGAFRSSFAYQSIMFIVAGQIIGRHHPNGWDGFLRDRLFTPLGMTRTFTTSPTAAQYDNRASGHRKLTDGAIHRMDEYPMPDPNAAGSIHTTARDLSKWLQFQLGDGRWRGKQLVSAAGLAETHKPQNIIPTNDLTRLMNPDTVQLTYAMGWVVQDYRGVKVLAHAGLIDGFRCQLTLLPDHGYAIGVLNNLHATRMNLPLSNRLIDLLLELPEKDWHAHFAAIVRAEDREREQTRKRREESRARHTPPSLPLPAFAGTYEHPAYGTCVVRHDAGKLAWKWSTFDRELLPLMGDTFELRDVVLDEQEATFTIKDGRVATMNALGVEFVRK